MRHGLILVLLDVGSVWMTVCRERGLWAFLEDLLNGTEWQFGAGNA